MAEKNVLTIYLQEEHMKFLKSTKEKTGSPYSFSIRKALELYKRKLIKKGTITDGD